MLKKSTLLTSSILTSEVDPSAELASAQNFQEVVNQALHHVLINKSGVLADILSYLIRKVVYRDPGQQLGVAYFHIGTSTSNTKGKEVPPE